ncbi:MAG: hypothetical protein IKN46_04735, partial [Acholeplasmatales bacterium]|nr:hypothetical protein [Acholeplasmatales bacterium]
MRKNNRKDNLKKNNQKTIVRINIIALLTSFALLIVAAVTVFLLIKPSKFEKKFMAYEGYYNTAQTPIGSSTATANYIKMSSLYTRTDATVSVKQGATLPTADKFVSIETKDDLYAFDQLCNNTSTQFNTYNYVLLKNIDWKEGSTLYFDPINNFKGVFDGNGYLIKNLSLKPEADETLSENYAMFKDVNSGATIKNFGLIDPLISINASFTSGSTIYIANVCAVNHGTIDYVFVRDNQENYPSSVEHTPGMTVAVPGYHISGLVGVNEGTFTNSYFAASNIFNVTKSGKPDDFQEVLLSNSGTVKNLFFYDELIADYQETGTKAQIKYSELNRTYNYNPHYGTYCTDLQDLCDKVTSVENTNWIIGSYYVGNNFGSLIDYTTPRLMKIDKNSVDYSNNKYTVVIDSVEDFNFIWNSMNENSKFSDSSMIYKFSESINMNDIAAPSYNDSIQSEFISDDTSSPITIYYNNYNYYLNSTYKSYGVFPVFEGKMSYINFVVGSEDNPVTINTETTGTKAIGTAIGYAENATIDNVNVYANIAVDNAIGKYFIGGIAGAIGDKTVISNSTVAGKITTTNNSQASFSDDLNNVNGIAIGGAVGFVAKSGGSLDTVLSKVNIKSAGYPEKEVNIGGIAGAGYFIDTNKLHNKGKIEVKTGDSGAGAYSQIHLAGVIGRIMGMYSQANNFTNNGDIDLYQAANAPTYYAGILNADIQTENVGTYSLFYKGKRQFWASKLSNGANIKIYNANSNAVIMYTYGVNVKNNNEFQTQLSSVYNLNYRFGSDTPLEEMTINMNVVKTFAPVIVSNNTSKEAYSIVLNTIYNLRDIKYDTSDTLTSSVKYTGCVLGSYVNYINVRNEGNQEMTIDNALTGNVDITGLFYELTGGFTASSIYNGGNITVTYTAIVTGNINASGICYANKNGFTNAGIQKFNPSNDNYDKTAIGSINNCVNNGSITVTNTTYESIPYAHWEIKSANGQVETENHWCPGTQNSVKRGDVTVQIVDEYDQTTYLNGNINVSGIVTYNYSVITNTFNIGDMFAANYIKARQKNEINASGLVIYNIGQYAIVENCANDGDIKAINLSFYMNFNNGYSIIDVTTGEYAYVNSSGIVCHNDINVDGSTYNNSNGHSKQIIAFTINYGSIYSYNYRRNSTTSADPNFRTISAGILGQGLLNTINVMNYGNVYGSEVSGGIIGVMFFECFKTEVTASNNVTFANTINYSPVLVIDKGELVYRDSSLYSYQTYSSFKELNNSSACYFNEIPVYSQDYFNGSIFGIINFNGDSNAQYMKIRYLISFNDDIKLVSKEASTPELPEGTIDLSTFFSAYYKYESAHIIDKYMGNNVTYAPLSSDSTKLNGITYQGVFSQNFPFYQAIKGNSNYVDVVNHKTDIFISDYFEFVGVLYVNPILLEKIGWGSMAYTAAADSFASNLSSVIYYVDYLSKLQNGTPYSDLVSTALNTDTWISKCDETLLTQITEKLIEEENVNALLAMIRYIFTTGSDSYSIIKTSTRTKILEDVLASDLSIDYSSLLDTIISYAGGYSNLLANSALDQNDEAGIYLKNYIQSLSTSAKETILTSYCNYLKDSDTNNYFTYSTSEQKRFDILVAIFNNIDDDSFYESFASLIGIKDAIESATINSQTQMYEGYSKLSNQEKITLYQSIIFNNTSSSNFDRLYTYITSMTSEIEYYVKMVENGYNKISLSSVYSDVDTSTPYDNTDITPPLIVDERVALWNQIRNTNVFKTYLSSILGTEYVAKATEFRNTFQSVTTPVDTAMSNYGDLTYSYTYNITPSTYFFGPYKNANKDSWNANSATDNRNNSRPTYDNDYQNPGSYNTMGLRPIMDVSTKVEADYLYQNGFTTNYQLFYYEYVDSSSNNQFCAVQRDGEGTYAFTWFKTSRTTDFTGGIVNGRYDADGIWYDEPVTITVNGDTIDVSGGGISKFTSNTDGSTGESNYGNNLTKGGTWVITDINGKQYTVSGTLTDWADFIIAHEVRHYVSYPTTQIHPTKNTGIFRVRSGNRWFTWYDNTRLMHTSQYIDYSIDDLLKLDGYLTSFEDGTTKDNTERDIINTLFNTYFVTSSIFEKMVAAALLERNSYVDDDSFYIVTPTLNQNFTLYYTLTATAANEYNVNKKYYKLENNNYIEVDIKNVTSSNYSTYYFVTATRAKTYVAGTTYYEKKDIDYYDYEYLDRFFITNIYTSTRISEQHPFDYLYQTYSSNTVKQYLIGNVSSDFKDKFIAYCASNQSAYAKLLLELIEINGYSTKQLPINIGNSTDPNAIIINGINSYTNLTGVSANASITDSDDETRDYYYGYTFNNLNIEISSSYERIALFVGPVNSSGTLKYALDNGAYTTVNVTGNQFIIINLNNNSLLKLQSDNKDVVFFEVVYAPNSTYDSDTWQYFYDSDTTYKPGYIIYTLPTLAEVENYVTNYILDFMSDYGYTSSDLLTLDINVNGISVT